MSITRYADTSLDEPWLTIGEQAFKSRLIVGIEQYESASGAGQVLKASGTDVVITTMDPDSNRSSLLLDDLAEQIEIEDFHWIGTTSFARSADSALRTARLIRDCYGINVIKLDVRTTDNAPDNPATVKAAEILRAEGMELLPFVLPDVGTARTLKDLGCAALRVMAAPVASGLGIQRSPKIREVIEQTDLPVIVEGGLGTVEHVIKAMELGAAAVLVNTALAKAARPALLAESMKHAVRAGLLAFRAVAIAE